MPEEGSGAPRRLLLALTLLAPLVLLVALELALRLVGFGGSYPLFVDSPGNPGYRQANPDVIQRYYARAPELAIDPIPFKAAKPPDGYRIVVQGGSSAAGFPYGRWGGLAGMLGDRLEAAFPDREIEVITTAMAAVNSYTLLDFVDEIIEIEPDAVLVYAGHNEYVGLLGAGSVLTSARSREATLLHLRLRRFRVYQLLQWLVSAARGLMTPRGEGGADRGTLIARAASSSLIPFGSDTYRRGVLQLEGNLRRMLAAYARAGIPVYLGTLTSNEKDLPPLASRVADSVDRAAWQAASDAFRRARDAGDIGAARDALHTLLALDGDAAAVWYDLGRLEQEAGDTEAARTAYRNAKDRDQLRLRAPAAFNEVIRALADSAAARLADVERRMELASPDGIAGDELLTDHVHPNAEGYFLLADAYYEALRRDQEIGSAADWSRAPSLAEARRDMPITAVDRMLAEHAIRAMKADRPFRDDRLEVAFPEPRGEIERLARRNHEGELSWLELMERLLQLYREAGRDEEALVVARIAAQAYPTQRAPNFAAGMLLLDAGRVARARRYLERSLAAQPDDPAALQALTRIGLELDDPSAARRHLARLKQVAPRHPAIPRLERRLDGIDLSSPAPEAPES